MPNVMGEVDGRHAASAQLSLDTVPIREGGAQALAHRFAPICLASAGQFWIIAIRRVPRPPPRSMINIRPSGNRSQFTFALLRSAAGAPRVTIVRPVTTIPGPG